MKTSTLLVATLIAACSGSGATDPFANANYALDPVTVTLAGPGTASAVSANGSACAAIGALTCTTCTIDITATATTTGRAQSGALWVDGEVMFTYANSAEIQVIAVPLEMVEKWFNGPGIVAGMTLKTGPQTLTWQANRRAAVKHSVRYRTGSPGQIRTAEVTTQC